VNTNPAETSLAAPEATLSSPAPAWPPEAEAVQRQGAAPAASGENPLPSALALRLRNNPAAAREAFIYAEIFGRPLGDRHGSAE
jgi:hypothetical protein